MKNITIEFYNREANYILLSDFNDVLEYAEILGNKVRKAAYDMIQSKLPPDRLDHLGGLGGVAATAAKFRGTSPLLELGGMADEKIGRFIRYISEGEKIMVNCNGGYCFVTPDTKILRESPYEELECTTYVVNSGTKVINLENDPELESYTVDYLSKVDPNYSYVCNLRDFSRSQLVNIFKEFKTNGGESAFLYTTGADIEQIHNYCEALVEGGITKIDFEFNSGISDELRSTLDIIAETMEITVKEL